MQFYGFIGKCKKAKPKLKLLEVASHLAVFGNNFSRRDRLHIWQRHGYKSLKFCVNQQRHGNGWPGQEGMLDDQFREHLFRCDLHDLERTKRSLRQLLETDPYYWPYAHHVAGTIDTQSSFCWLFRGGNGPITAIDLRKRLNVIWFSSLSVHQIRSHKFLSETLDDADVEVVEIPDNHFWMLSYKSDKTWVIKKFKVTLTTYLDYTRFAPTPKQPDEQVIGIPGPGMQALFDSEGGFTLIPKDN